MSGGTLAQRIAEAEAKRDGLVDQVGIKWVLANERVRDLQRQQRIGDEWDRIESGAA